MLCAYAASPSDLLKQILIIYKYLFKRPCCKGYQYLKELYWPRDERTRQGTVYFFIKHTLSLFRFGSMLQTLPQSPPVITALTSEP